MALLMGLRFRCLFVGVRGGSDHQGHFAVVGIDTTAHLVPQDHGRATVDPKWLCRGEGRL